MGTGFWGFIRRIFERDGSIALLAGGFCYALALTVVVLSPEWLTNQSDPTVVGLDGIPRDVKPYTEVEARGRDVYGKQVCWHCHSQFIRPVNDEDKRWGPVSQTGEYAYDIPHFFGTRRVGPDLQREGGRRTDDWHLAHLFDPRFTVPRSVMPNFDFLFTKAPRASEAEAALKLLDTSGDGIVSGKVDDVTTSVGGPSTRLAQAKEAARLLDTRGVRPPRRLDDPPGDPIRWKEASERGDGLLTELDFGPRATEKAHDVVAYLQRLGTNIGMWWRPTYASAPSRVSPFAGADERPRRPAALRVYGWLDRDPAYTLDGVPDAQQEAALAEVKGKVDAARAERAKAQAEYDAALAAWNSRYPLLAERLQKGRAVYERHCLGCHGEEGRGNGPAAPFLETRPRDFTLGKYRYRSTELGHLPLDGDLYRSIFRGLPGSPMPTWKELSDEQIWLLVDYLKSLYEGDKKFNDRDKIIPVPPPRVDPTPDVEILRGRAVYLAAQCANCHGVQGEGDGEGWDDTTSDYGGRVRPRDLRPRLKNADTPELYVLLGRHLERLVGAPAWAKVSAGEKWKDLSPATPEKQDRFARLLLGMGGKMLDAIGGADLVREAMGEKDFERVFGGKNDPLEPIRMAVATEKDQPAMRFRGGASEQDLYRTVFTGLDGVGMKPTFNDMFKRERVKTDATAGLSRREAPVTYVLKEGAVPLKVHILKGDRIPYPSTDPNKPWILDVPAEPDLASVGVTAKTTKDDKGVETERSFIEFRPGDDWALIHYVMWIACIPPQKAGD